MQMPPAAVTSGARNTTPVSQDRIARKEGRLQRSQPLMRKYEVAHLTSRGEIEDFQKIAPAHPLFEEAFSAFARGLVFQTEQGPVAVEDLLPGHRIRTASGSYRTLRWKGSMMVVPGSVSETATLLRVSTEAFGWQRPAFDVVLGPNARLFHKTAGIKAHLGYEGAFVPLRDFVDGNSVVEITPMQAVEVFHLGFAQHERLCAGGLEVESYHPGSLHKFPLRGEMLGSFMSLFPHLRDLGDFGMKCQPRLNLAELEMFSAA